jgi:two-component system LytT family response regulator
MKNPARVFLVDDEPLALRRLRRLLEATHRVDIVGESTDAREALDTLRAGGVDAAFLDIQMPGTSGLELAAELAVPPWIVFVTAYDRYALGAFEVNAIDYLLKPVHPGALTRALDKLERALALPELQAGAEAAAFLERVERALRGKQGPAERIAARVETRYVLVELSRVTHFRADSKLTFAFTADAALQVEASLAELEARLGDGFARIHRGFLVNLSHVDELELRGAGAWVRLRGPRGAGESELPVSRDRVRALKVKMGIRG